MHPNSIPDEDEWLKLIRRSRLRHLWRRSVASVQKRRLEDLRKRRLQEEQRRLQSNVISQKRAATATKLIWIICVLGSIWQIVELFQLYLSYPTLFDLKIVQTNTSTLPAVAI